MKATGWAMARQSLQRKWWLYIYTHTQNDIKRHHAALILVLLLYVRNLSELSCMEQQKPKTWPQQFAGLMSIYRPDSPSVVNSNWLDPRSSQETILLRSAKSCQHSTSDQPAWNAEVRRFSSSGSGSPNGLPRIKVQPLKSSSHKWVS